MSREIHSSGSSMNGISPETSKIEFAIIQSANGPLELHTSTGFKESHRSFPINVKATAVLPLLTGQGPEPSNPSSILHFGHVWEILTPAVR